MAVNLNCISIKRHESRFSKSTERIKSKNISFERLFKAQASFGGQLNTCFPFVRTFGPKIPVQMFAYFISKLLCNIYQSLDVRDEKRASLELKHR